MKDVGELNANVGLAVKCSGKRREDLCSEITDAAVRFGRVGNLAAQLEARMELRRAQEFKWLNEWREETAKAHKSKTTLMRVLADEAGVPVPSLGDTTEDADQRQSAIIDQLVELVSSPV